MRKPRHCRNCGALKTKEKPPTEWPASGWGRYRISGKLKIPKRRFVNAMTCRACGRGVIWLYVFTPGRIQLVAVQPQSWDAYPSLYYIKGKHIPHQTRCPEFLKMLGRVKLLNEKDLYVECPEVPK